MTAAKGEDPWDDYCVSAARAVLLFEAARMTKEAGTYKAPGDAVVELESMVKMVVTRVSCAGMTVKEIAAAWSEAGFARFMFQVFKLNAKEVADALDRVRFEARKLRGQLDLFGANGEKGVVYYDADAFIREQLTDAAGKLILTSVRNEIADYFVIMHEVRRVYMHVTGDRVSLPNTMADQVIVLADDHANALVQEHLAGMTIDELRALLAEKERQAQTSEKDGAPCEG